MNARRSAQVGVLMCFLSVALGAFGAHALKARLSTEMLQIFETGVRYQIFHGLALLAIPALMNAYPSKWICRGAVFLTGGTVIFSGSLYTLSLSGVKIWGAVTPIGGLGLLIGWALLLLGLRAKSPT